VGIVLFENLFGCLREVMEFHLWYPKGKGFIQSTGTREFAITAAGVDEIMGRVSLRLTQPASILRAGKMNIATLGEFREKGFPCLRGIKTTLCFPDFGLANGANFRNI